VSNSAEVKGHAVQVRVMCLLPLYCFWIHWTSVCHGCHGCHVRNTAEMGRNLCSSTGHDICMVGGGETRLSCCEYD